MKIYLCAIAPCTKPQLAHTWCDNHYRRWRRHGHPLGGKHYRTDCSVDDCAKRHHAKGYCAMHYQRAMNHDDPNWKPYREVDDVAVLRAVNGERPDRMTMAEREAVVIRLHRRGLRDGQIAQHLDVGTSGVWTIRQRLGLPANASSVGAFSGREAV